jgi:hypothetical protein
MRIGRSLALVFVIGISVALALPNAAQAQTCFLVGPPPDGRLLGPYFLSNGTNDISLAWRTEVGRSYSVEVMTDQGPSGAGALSPAVNIDTTFCPITDVASGFIIRDTSGITPRPCTGCGFLRRSIVSATAADLEMRIHNNNASISAAQISVTETTMFSPAWSTNSTYETFYSLLNTTDATCNVRLTLMDTGGTVRTNFSGAINTGATLATNTFALGTARNLSGTARLTHDCPPGTIVAEAAIANFSISPTPYFQGVKFIQASRR